jgi:YHS domain-containing protein
MKISKLILACTLIVSVTSCASLRYPPPSAEELAAAKPYPLDTCLVIDRPLRESKRTYTKIYKGQVVKFCCTPCIKAFNTNPETFMHKVK